MYHLTVNRIIVKSLSVNKDSHAKDTLIQLAFSRITMLGIFMNTFSLVILLLMDILFFFSVCNYHN